MSIAPESVRFINGEPREISYFRTTPAVHRIFVRDRVPLAGKIDLSQGRSGKGRQQEQKTRKPDPINAMHDNPLIVAANPATLTHSLIEA